MLQFQVAIKYIKKNKVQDDTDLCRLRREIHKIKSINHHPTPQTSDCIVLGSYLSYSKMTDNIFKITLKLQNEKKTIGYLEGLYK
jgi:serine/threonine protein kinase